MINLDDFSMVCFELRDLAHITKWANLNLFKSINANRHKLPSRVMEAVLTSLPETSKLFIIYKNDSVQGFCEFYEFDIKNKSSGVKIHLEDKSISMLKPIQMVKSVGFGRFGLHRLYAEVFFDDSSRLASFKQMGFLPEVHRRAHVFVDGTFKTVSELAARNLND